MEQRDYIKYGICLFIIGFIFLPFMVIFKFSGGNETQVLSSVFGLLSSIPFLAGSILLIIAYVMRVMSKTFGKQACPICGEKMLVLRGFLKIYCEGCQQEIPYSAFGVEVKMREWEEQRQGEQLQNCPDCGSPLSMREGRKFCPFCDKFL